MFERFTNRARHVVVLAQEEARKLQHNYIGTEHILLGVIREGEGVGAQIMKQHSADLATIRTAVLDLLSTYQPAGARRTRWLRRGSLEPGLEPVKPGKSTELRTTPAADSSLSEAARLAGTRPVGSHHLLLAALGDPDTAAAKALAALGVDLAQAREALRTADVTGTSDEPPEEAGGRQMVIHVTAEKLTVEATDPLIVEAGRAALRALGDEAEASGTIRGDQPATESLAKVWQAVQDSLGIIQRRSTLPNPPEGPDKPSPKAA
jgi:ATP-dependent Clp protease ATP-binding subunit ClpA